MDILIVEDNIELAQSLKQLLEQNGHTAQTVPSGVEAKKAVSETPFDICIVDFILPDCKGSEFVSEIGQDESQDTPYFILISGLFDEKFILDLIPEPLKKITHFIKKPLAQEDILKTIKKFNTVDTSLSNVFFSSLNNLNDYIRKNEDKTFNGHQLINILFIAYKTKLTGQLKICFTDQEEKTIFFNEGYVYKLTSKKENSKSYFGALLVKHGFAIEEEIQKILKEKSPDKLIGCALLEQGLLSPDMIIFILREQISIQLSEMISKSSFVIEITESPETEELSMDSPYFLESDLIHLTIEGIKKTISEKQLEIFYYNNKDKNILLNKVITSTHPDYRNFLSRYKDLLEKLDHTKNLEQNIKNFKMDRVSVLQIFYFGNITNSIDFICSSKDQTQMKRAEALLMLIKNNDTNDLFKNLNLPWKASKSEIEKNYKKIISVLHPDALSRDLSENKKKEYREAFQKATESYEILSDPEKQKDYINKQNDQTFLNSVLEYERGVKAIKQKKYELAVEILEEVSKEHQAPKHTKLYLLWAQIEKQSKTLKTDSHSFVNIKKQIDDLSMEQKLTALYWFVNGLYYKYIENYKRSVSSFNKALYLKPNFKEAHTELSQIKELLQHLKQKKTKILSRFFKSKKAS